MTVTTFTGKVTPPFTGGVQRTLGSKVFETVSVTDFGAVGDGTTLANAAFLAAAVAHTTVLVPDGTYALDTLTFGAAHANTTFFLSAGAILLHRAGAAGAMITSSGGDLNITFDGGIADGNKANVTNKIMFQPFGNGVNIKNMTVRNGSARGYRGFAVDKFSIVNCKFIGNIGADIDCQAGTRDLAEIFIDGIFVDRRGVAGNTGAIKIIGSQSYDIARSRCTNITVLNDQVSSSLALGVELWSWQNSVVGDWLIIGGGMGVSFGINCADLAVGRIVCKDNVVRGFEIAGDSPGTGDVGVASGLVFENVIIDGGGVCRRAVECNKGSNVIVKSLYIRNAGILSGADAGRLVSWTNSENVRIEGLDAVATAGAGQAVFLDDCTGFDIDVKLLDGNASMVHGVRARDSSGIRVRNGIIQNMTTAEFYLESTDATTSATDIRIEKVACAVITTATSGTGTIGDVSAIECPGLTRSGAVSVDVLDLAGDRIEAVTSATPESALTAAVGSKAFNRATGTEYRKTSGAGNTGWVALAVV